MHARGPTDAGAEGDGAEGAAAAQRGFTLVELLVVMVVLSLLAAIAVPAFYSQREKARDAEAKAALSAAQVAIETYAIDNDGEYSGATVPLLVGVEGSLADTALSVLAAAQDAYRLQIVSKTGTGFLLERLADGRMVRSCAPVGSGGCSTAGTW